MTLENFLTSILGGTIALGPAVFYAFEYFGVAATLAPERKRLLVALVSAFLGVSAWSLAVNLGYVSAPVDRAAIAEAIWQYGLLAGLSAFASSNVIHGFARKKALDKRNELLFATAGEIKCLRCPDAKCGLCPETQEG